MKKVLTLVAVAGMFTFISCGPSAEEKAAQAENDRLQHENDSINHAQAAEEEIRLAKEKEMNDTMKVDSAAVPVDAHAAEHPAK